MSNLPSQFPADPQGWIDLLESLPDVDAIPIAAAWERDPGGFWQGWIDAGHDTSAVTLLVQKCKELRAKAGSLPGQRLLDWLEAAQTHPAEPISDQEPDDPPGEQMPRFPTSVPELDARTKGGYGMTVIAAQAKCGKSMLALAIAIQAALKDWRVLYLNAELTRTEMTNRLLRYCGSQIPEKVCDNLSIHAIEYGVGIPHILQKAKERVGMEDEKLLIVMDSINRVANLAAADMNSEYGYFKALAVWQEWLRRCALVSDGRVASVVVSELNAGGNVKGRQLEFAADLVLRIKPSKDMGENAYDLDVPFARSSAGGKLGVFDLNWLNGRFEYVGAATYNVEDDNPWYDQ